MSGYSEIHWVTITLDPDEEGWLDYEVEHPDSCPMIPAPSLTPPGEELAMEHDCWVQHDLNYVGADLFEGFPHGKRVAFRCWSSGPDHHGEYDGGAEIVEEGEA